MSYEPATIRLLRETLETRMPSRDAIAVVFEALNAWGPTIPSGRSELVRVVQGPLRSALLRRLSEQDVHALLRRVEVLLLTSEVPTGKVTTHEVGGLPVGSGTVAHECFPDERTTHSLPNVGGAARVVVLSASDGFANHLSETLGSWRVRTATVHTLQKLLVVDLDDPSIVLVDCGLPPPVEISELVTVLRSLNATVWRAIWGSDLAFGAELVQALEAAGVQCIPIPVRSGIAPLVDLVSARAPS